MISGIMSPLHRSGVERHHRHLNLSAALATGRPPGIEGSRDSLFGSYTTSHESPLDPVDISWYLTSQDVN